MPDIVVYIPCKLSKLIIFLLPLLIYIINSGLRNALLLNNDKFQVFTLLLASGKMALASLSDWRSSRSTSTSRTDNSKWKENPT